jgi:hypothetical protein
MALSVDISLSSLPERCRDRIEQVVDPGKVVRKDFGDRRDAQHRGRGRRREPGATVAEREMIGVGGALITSNGRNTRNPTAAANPTPRAIETTMSNSDMRRVSFRIRQRSVCA